MAAKKKAAKKKSKLSKRKKADLKAKIISVVNTPPGVKRNTHVSKK